MRITIYTKNDCVQCHAFEMVNVEHHPNAADMLREQGFRQLPVVIAGETRWSGFRPDMINRLRPEPVANA